MPFLPKFTSVTKPLAVKKLSLSIFASIIVISLYAQDTTTVAQPSPPQTSSSQPTYRQSKSNAKKERMNNMLKMEEEGDLIFNKHNIFGIRLATDGYGIFFEKGKFKSVNRTLLFDFELNEKKDPKEHKVSFSPDGFNYSSIVLYKLNNFYEFKVGMGQQHLIGGKGNKNGVAVTFLYTGGLSLALLKPYYLNVTDGNSEYKVTFPQYINNIANYSLEGASGFTVGWGNLTTTPGVHARTAMRFDYGRLNQNITAIEAGMTAEYFFSKIPQMEYVAPKQFFFNAYISIMFGSRK